LSKASITLSQLESFLMNAALSEANADRADDCPLPPCMPPGCIIRKTFRNVFILPTKQPSSLAMIDQMQGTCRNPIALSTEWQEALSTGALDSLMKEVRIEFA
jgi:hypothetical protein